MACNYHYLGRVLTWKYLKQEFSGGNLSFWVRFVLLIILVLCCFFLCSVSCAHSAFSNVYLKLNCMLLENLTLGYMTKTLNQIIFFFLHQNQNIFFSNIGNKNIFLEKKTIPPPPPFQVKRSVPKNYQR